MLPSVYACAVAFHTAGKTQPAPGCNHHPEATSVAWIAPTALALRRVHSSQCPRFAGAEKHVSLAAWCRKGRATQTPGFWLTSGGNGSALRAGQGPMTCDLSLEPTRNCSVAPPLSHNSHSISGNHFSSTTSSVDASLAASAGASLSLASAGA